MSMALSWRKGVGVGGWQMELHACWQETGAIRAFLSVSSRHENIFRSSSKKKKNSRRAAFELGWDPVLVSGLRLPSMLSAPRRRVTVWSPHLRQITPFSCLFLFFSLSQKSFHNSSSPIFKVLEEGIPSWLRAFFTPPWAFNHRPQIASRALVPSTQKNVLQNCI